MSSAKASGADAGSSNARSREHQQGNQGRSYTVEQKAAVIRIRQCSPTAFYDILGLEEVKKTVTDSEVKKAYRKLSLLTHPDKNGHEHADEAFKMVSRAFGVLGDKEKRERFDRSGVDPDSRFGQAQAQNPFSGFASRGGGGAPGGGGFGGGFQGEEMTPEEMFQRFFGGGGGFGGFGGGPFGGFDTGPQFAFNFGGGPGFRVHQFGGGRPRRRPREGQQGQAEGGLSPLLGMLPLLLFFVFPILSGLFSGDSGRSSTPQMHFDTPSPPYTMQRETSNSKVPYFVNPVDVESYSKNKLSQLDRSAEATLVRTLQFQCENEMNHKRRMYDAAQGWFFQDPVKMQEATAYATPSCDRAKKLGLLR
ncbi:HLJ1 [Verticillium alfalfae VaMs.102]|uniref:HLJ1 n=1 Tax=Verticillium alfalfae (strain VaMs.102 / ATCC MYA-4576 / FGSC 10136) TaxID=526221 RepID=C9SJT9_VERA1|nr:HLJ1 [Verticillium alfalfae VaMs.102]EEY19703.1 HLJ1 [Verticillium alfalfae VaMs.102]